MLLVEDVRVSQKLCMASLKKAKYKSVGADNGQDAVDKFIMYQETLEVVLMDINMPGMNGMKATETIRKYEAEHRPDRDPVVILGLTGNVDAISLKNYQTCGMNGCIVKGKLLVDALKKALRQLEENCDAFVNLSDVAMLEDNDEPASSPVRAIDCRCCADAAPVGIFVEVSCRVCV